MVEPKGYVNLYKIMCAYCRNGYNMLIKCKSEINSRRKLMSKKRIVIKVIFCVLIVMANLYVFFNVKYDIKQKTEVKLNIELNAEKAFDLQVYYSSDEQFSEDRSQLKNYDGASENSQLEYEIFLNSPYVRLDFGDSQNNITIKNAYFECKFGKKEIDLNTFLKNEISNDIDTINVDKNEVKIKAEKGDPYIALQLDFSDFVRVAEEQGEKASIILDILICILIDFTAIIIFKRINLLIEICGEFFRERALIWSLSKNDFKTKFAGSYLGIVWAFVQPVVTVLVYWFVFQVGLRAGRTSDHPFILWLMAGIVPWFFFSEALSGGTNALVEYSYLVKKVVFKIDILPMVKVISSLFVHMFFILFVIILCWCYGYVPGVHSLQLIYYVICNFVLVLGLVYLTSAVVVFFKDLLQIINIILQVGIWMTPIMWDAGILNSRLLKIIFKLNPMYYVVDGFRDALLGDSWLGNKIMWTIYFWIFVAFMFMAGVAVFRRLRIHFADVL